MTKVFMVDLTEAPALPQTFISLVFWPNYRFPIPEKRLFLREIMAPYAKPFFEIVASLSEADFVAVPFDYFFAEKYAPEYLAKAYWLAREAKKKVLLFDYTDYVDRNPKIPPHAVLFRVSAYRHHKKPNEIVMPYFVEDFGSRYDIAPKIKGSPLIVGYCGQTQFGTTIKKWKAMVKRILRSIVLHLTRDVNPPVHTRGIFLRRHAIRFLREGGTITKIIERKFYSLHQSGVSFDPNEVRQEYVKNLEECDLALCARGDSNASQRFYEALSASRVPLFLDTDCVLPLEAVISYDDFIVRVSSSDVAHIAQYVEAWNSGHNASSFLEKEKSAREAYEKYLRLDRYFEIVFDREKSPYKDVLYGV